MNITSTRGDDGGCTDRPNGIIVVVVEGSRARNHGGRFRCAYSADRQGLPEAPPIPDKFVDPAGAVVFTADDVIAGQQVFLKHGLIDNGTIWGQGGYLGPDFSAQSLHILALDLTEGFGTVDLQAAKQLLDELSVSPIERT